MAFGDQTDPFLIKQNDTRPVLRYYVKQGPSGATAVSMATATSVVFNMRLAADPDTVKTSRATADIIDPAVAGGLQYEFTEDDTEDEGTFIGEFEITFDDGGILTVPTGENWIYITIGDDIA